MSIVFRRIFARNAADEAANIRESIRRDNLRAIRSNAPYVRDEYVTEFERALRLRHRIPVESNA